VNLHAGNVAGRRGSSPDDWAEKGWNALRCRLHWL